MLEAHPQRIWNRSRPRGEERLAADGALHQKSDVEREEGGSLKSALSASSAKCCRYWKREAVRNCGNRGEGVRAVQDGGHGARAAIFANALSICTKPSRSAMRRGFSRRLAALRVQGSHR
jgi:hypothetical protein